jgi:hypothetical protein
LAEISRELFTRIGVGGFHPFSQATKALRESRGIALLGFWTSALEGGEASASRPGRFLPPKDPVPMVQKVGWASGPVWAGAGNLASTEIRSPDRPARSQSLYRPSYRNWCHLRIPVPSSAFSYDNLPIIAACVVNGQSPGCCSCIKYIGCYLAFQMLRRKAVSFFKRSVDCN